jgi:hypothetical protein
MSKRLARRGKSRAVKKSPKSRAKPLVIICSLLALALAIGVMARWKAFPGASKPLALAPNPQGSFSANSPSKEYIYAGGRLIATEEPGAASSASIANAVADFSPSQNPTGAWSYGYSTSSIAFTLFTAHSNIFGPAIDTWGIGGGSCCPMVARNNSSSTQSYAGSPSVIHPADLLNLHPGNSGERAIVRWTAPSAMTIKIEGRFQGLDNVGTTTDVSIASNTTQFWSGAINGYGNQATFSVTRTVSTGETIDFRAGMGSNGNYNNDSTGLAVTLSDATPAANAVADFSASQNPAGQWSYGYNTASTAFTPFTAHSNLYGPAIDSWGVAGGYCCPMVAGNNSGSTQSYSGAPSVIHPADLLNLHPGNSGERAVVRWTAPSAMTVKIEGRFQGLDNVGTTTDVAIVSGVTTLWSGAISGYGNQATFSVLRSVTAGETMDFRVGVGSNNNYNNDSTGLAVTISGQSAGGRINVARSSNGGVATASSTTPDTAFPGMEFNPSSVNDGDRKGSNYPHNAFWRDYTADIFPDWLQVDFNGTKVIDEIDVFSVQDSIEATPAEPTENMAFSVFGIVDFQVQCWTGSYWVTVPGGKITGNNKVWRKITFSPVVTSKIRVYITNAQYNQSRIVELEAWTAQGSPQINYALEANGGVASASSTTPNSQFPGYDFAPCVATDGDRKSGINFWRDDTSTFADWLEVDFSGSKTINQVSVFSLQDNDQNPSDPNETMTCTLWGVKDFEVQYWNGSAWAQVPNGLITNNNLVWKKISFSPVTASKIRVWITNTQDGARSRIVEVEAWGN